jgi:MFS family permease
MTLARAGAAREGGNRWAALAALYLAMFMNILDISVVNLALPVIRADLGASDTELEWVLVIYVLTFAAGLLPFGRFGDVLGRGRLFCWGVGGFTVSSLACGLAPDTTILIASRGAQGLSAAMMVPQVLAIVHVMFAEEEKGRAIGLFGSVSALGAVAGPLVGGVLVWADLFGLGWRPIFLINLPIGLVSLYGALRFLPDLGNGSRLKPDWTGTLLFTLAVLALVFPLVEGRQFGWPLWCFALIGLSAVLAVLFCLVQRRKAGQDLPQLLPVALTGDKVFLAGVLFVAAFFSAMAGLFFMMAIYLQAGLGLTPLFAGLVLAPHPVGVILASAYSGRFGTRWFSGRIVASTLMVLCALVAIRFVVLSGRAPETLLLPFLLPFLLLGLGVGTGIPALFQMVLSRVGGVDAGAGSGVLQAFQQVGMAFGIAIQGQIFFQMLGADMSEASYRQAAQATLVYPIGVLAGLFCLTVVRWNRFRFWHG